MADVKWIKITTDMFDNRKIKHLRRLPEGDSIVLIWIMLLTLAGRCNANGMIFLTENIPYTPKMLADELDFEESIVRLALDALEQLGMIQSDGFLAITGWEEHQNVDRLSEIREYNRLAKQKSRAKQKLLPEVSEMSMTCQPCHETDIDKEEDKEKDKDKSKKKDKDPFLVYQSSNPELFQALKDYESMRKQMKKPLTIRSKEMLLEKLASFPDKDWIPMLNVAINRNWLSVYPLKENQTKPSVASKGSANYDTCDQSYLDALGHKL